MMTRALFLALLCAFACSGCRQPDGTMPTPQGEQANKTDDIRRDLLAVARQEKAAAQDLKTDLDNLTGAQPPGYLIEDLSSGLETALAGAKLPDDSAKKLAHHLFVAICARELSDRQIELLRKDVTGTLVATGVPAAKAEPVAAAVGDIQRAMTTNKRRWWQRG
jgi:hypothetical protein